MLSRFIEAKHPDGKPLSLKEVLIEAGTVVGAGSDTTGISLRAILYYVITNPNVYSKLMDEINEFSKDGKLSDPITFSESLKMPYFCACVKEALRMHSAVGYTLPRHVPEGGRTIAGRFFPAGVYLLQFMLIVSQKLCIAMNRCSDPRRTSSVLSVGWNHLNKQRIWIGIISLSDMVREFVLARYICSVIDSPKNISLMEMQKLIPTLFRRFHFDLVDPKKPWKTTCHWFVHQEDMDCYIQRN
jgi:cytochrome P450